MNIQDEASSMRLADTVFFNEANGIQRGLTPDGYELCSQLFPDGKRTIKYFLRSDGAKVPVQYIFSKDYSQQTWRYDEQTSCWYQSEDVKEEHPWRGIFGFDSEGQFYMRDERTLWLLHRKGTEFRSRTDEAGIEAAVKIDRNGICIFARSADLEWSSEDGKLWQSACAGSSKLMRMKFELHLNGDFVIEDLEGRTEIQHRDGSRTVRLADHSYVEKQGKITLFNCLTGEDLGNFVDWCNVDEMPDTDRFFKSRVINESSRPVLLGAKNAEGFFNIYVVEARASTPFSKSPCFIVDDPRYQIRVIDGRVLVPCQLPVSATIFKLGSQKLKVTNDSWGMVLVGWPIAGHDTVSGVSLTAISVALRGPAKQPRKNRTVAHPNFTWAPV